MLFNMKHKTFKLLSTVKQLKTVIRDKIFLYLTEIETHYDDYLYSNFVY